MLARLPDGTPVVFAGGRTRHPSEADALTFANNVWKALDKVRDRVPDMVLIHGGDTKGVDRIASSWAERRNIPQVTFSLDMRLGARAGFKRNERMLSLSPRYVVAFPGLPSFETWIAAPAPVRRWRHRIRGERCACPRGFGRTSRPIRNTRRTSLMIDTQRIMAELAERQAERAFKTEAETAYLKQAVMRSANDTRLQVEPKNVTQATEINTGTIRLIRLNEVKRRTGMSTSTIYRWMNAGRVPRSHCLGGHIAVWSEDKVNNWMQEALNNRTPSEFAKPVSNW